MGSDQAFSIRGLLCCALVLTLGIGGAVTPARGAVIVQLRVVEGEGQVYATGSRATRGLTVQVTDEAGAPVEGATVSFRLPDTGPGGVFPGGLRTEVVTTQADGRAAIWGMQWNKIAGPFEIRITALKDRARAGLVSTEYLNDTVAKSGGTGTFQASHHGSTKWLLLGALAAGAGAGIALGHSSGAKAAVSPVTPTVIGSPTFTIGHP